MVRPRVFWLAALARDVAQEPFEQHAKQWAQQRGGPALLAYKHCAGQFLAIATVPVGT